MKNLENKARRNIQINDRLSRLKLSGQWTISILKKRDLKVQRVFFEIIKQLKSLSFLNFGDCDFLANRDDLLNCISTFISDRPFALTVYLNWNLNKGKKLSLSAADEMIQFFNQSASQPQYQQDEYENDIQTLGDVLMSYVSNVNFVIQSFALAEAFQDVGNTIAETQRTSLLSEYMRRYRFDLLRLGLTVD
jgi:hypothetical protein